MGVAMLVAGSMFAWAPSRCIAPHLQHPQSSLVRHIHTASARCPFPSGPGRDAVTQYLEKLRQSRQLVSPYKQAMVPWCRGSFATEYVPYIARSPAMFDDYCSVE